MTYALTVAVVVLVAAVARLYYEVMRLANRANDAASSLLSVHENLLERTNAIDTRHSEEIRVLSSKIESAKAAKRRPKWPRIA